MWSNNLVMRKDVLERMWYSTHECMNSNFFLCSQMSRRIGQKNTFASSFRPCSLHGAQKWQTRPQWSHVSGTNELLPLTVPKSVIDAINGKIKRVPCIPETSFLGQILTMIAEL